MDIYRHTILEFDDHVNFLSLISDPYMCVYIYPFVNYLNMNNSGKSLN